MLIELSLALLLGLIAGTFTGVSILLILSNIIEPKLSTISDLKTKQTYEQIRIQGQMINQKSYNNKTLNILGIASELDSSTINSYFLK